MKRLREILARKAEIRTALQGEGQVDLNALEQELRELGNEETELRARYDLANEINAGSVEGREIPNPADLVKLLVALFRKELADRVKIKAERAQISMSEPIYKVNAHKFP